MSQDTKKLLSDALRLSRRNRAMIAEKLLESLETKDDLEAVIELAEQRWEDYKAGRIKGIPIEDVFPNLASKAKVAKPIRTSSFLNQQWTISSKLQRTLMRFPSPSECVFAAALRKRFKRLSIFRRHPRNSEKVIEFVRLNASRNTVYSIEFNKRAFSFMGFSICLAAHVIGNQDFDD